MLDQEVHFLLLRAFHHSHKCITRRTQALGLCPGQPKILEYLLEHDGCIARDICEGCVLDKSTMTSLLGRMERQGLIVKEDSPLDRRAAAVRLTEEGRSMAEAVKAIFREVDARTLQNIPEAEQRQLTRLLQTVISNLEEEAK